MSRLIDLYISDSLEIVEKLKSKLNLLKSPMNLLNQNEINEMNMLQDKDNENFEKLKKYFEVSNQDTDVLESISIYRELKEEIEKRRKFIKYYEDKHTYTNRTFTKKSEVNASYIQYDTENSVISTIEANQEQDLPEIENHFLNSIITTRQVAELKEKNCLSKERQFLSEVFGLRESEEKDEILIDFYMSLYKFSIEKEFNVEESSTFLSIMYFIFNYSILGMKIIKQKSVELFMKIIEYHSNNFPPYFYYIFNSTRKKEIISYVNSSFYRNYSLYENIFKYNVNIFLSTKQPKQIPNDDFPSTQSLSFEFLKEKMKIPSRSQEERKEEEKFEEKGEYELYFNKTIKKIDDFQKRISKVNRNLDEELKASVRNGGKELVGKEEAEEVKEMLKVRVNEIYNETNERIMIGNKILERKINGRVEEVNNQGKKK